VIPILDTDADTGSDLILVTVNAQQPSYLGCRTSPLPRTFPSAYNYLNVKENLLIPFLIVTQVSDPNLKFIIIIDVVSKFLSIFNTLTTELLLLNCTGYATFSTVMYYAEFVHLLQLLQYARFVICACDRHYRP